MAWIKHLDTYTCTKDFDHRWQKKTCAVIFVELDEIIEIAHKCLQNQSHAEKYVNLKLEMIYNVYIHFSLALAI